MNNKQRKINWWAMLASFLGGVILGAAGVLLGKRYLAPRKNAHDEREGLDCCDYDFDDYYDDDPRFVAYGTKSLKMARTNGAVMLDAAPAMAAVEEESIQYEMAADESIEGADIPEDVAIRSEFLQALTFQPHLVSAGDGTLTFSFRTSDKLSTYYVRVYAHDPSMRNAIAEGEMVVSLPVKVAMRKLGYAAGPLRMPLSEMEPQHEKQLEDALRNHGLIK